MTGKNLTITIAGSRSFTTEQDYRLMRDALRDFLELQGLRPGAWGSPGDVVALNSGGARGADRLGERWARENACNIRWYRPEWTKHGRKAGVLRTRKMLEDSSLAFIMWDGWSKGTAYTLKMAEAMSERGEILLCSLILTNNPALQQT